MRVRNDGLSLYNDVNLPQLADTSLFFDRDQPLFFHQLAFDRALDYWPLRRVARYYGYEIYPRQTPTSNRH